MYQALLHFWKNSKYANRTFLALMLLFQIVIHLPMIHNSPRGMHVWRQVVGHAAVQNYLEEDGRFWHPRADIRMYEGDKGEIYHELPLTYWLSAKLTETGLTDRWTAANSIQLLFNLFMIPGAFYLLLALGTGRLRAFLFTFLIGFSPLYLAYAPLFEPNMLGLSLFMCGLALYLPSSDREDFGLRFWAGTLFFLLGTLAKPTYLFFGLPVLAWVLPNLWKQRNLKAWSAYALSGAIVGLGNVLVIRHAKTLYEASPFQRQIHTPIASPPLPDDLALIWSNISKALTTWFLEMNINMGAIPFLLIALVFIYKNKASDKRVRNFWLAWTVSLLIFSTAFLVRLADHDYYITASLPLAAWLSSLGAKLWLKSKRFRPLLAFLLCLVIPYLGVTRAYGRYFGKPQVPETILYHADEIAREIPKDDLVIIDGDKTPIVYLYYLKRKGLSISLAEGKMEPKEFKDFRWLLRYENSKILSDRTAIFQLGEGKKIRDFTLYPILGISESNKPE